MSYKVNASTHAYERIACSLQSILFRPKKYQNIKMPPNILVCGTPGTGKTQLCKMLSEAESHLEHVNLSEVVVNEPRLREEFDESTQSWILNDDAIVDYLEEKMARGGVILDTHSLIDYFPERWFELVIVLEADNTILFDRLSRRGYSPAKVHENVECEIMKVVRDEAVESYAEEIVQILPSNTLDDLESNLERVQGWLRLRENQGTE
jgi:broad-specificity NMP kinase